MWLLLILSTLILGKVNLRLFYLKAHTEFQLMQLSLLFAFWEQFPLQAELFQMMASQQDQGGK